MLLPYFSLSISLVRLAHRSSIVINGFKVTFLGSSTLRFDELIFQDRTTMVKSVEMLTQARTPLGCHLFGAILCFRIFLAMRGLPKFFLERVLVLILPQNPYSQPLLRNVDFHPSDFWSCKLATTSLVRCCEGSADAGSATTITLSVVGTNFGGVFKSLLSRIWSFRRASSIGCGIHANDMRFMAFANESRAIDQQQTSPRIFVATRNLQWPSITDTSSKGMDSKNSLKSADMRYSFIASTAVNKPAFQANNSAVLSGHTLLIIKFGM